MNLFHEVGGCKLFFENNKTQATVTHANLKWTNVN